MNETKLLDQIRKNIEQKTVNVNLAKEDNLVTNSVTKSNALARAYYRLTLSEKRCMEALISKLHPLRSDNEEAIELTAKAYSEAFSVQPNVAYRELRKAVEGLTHRIIKGYDEDLDIEINNPLMIETKYFNREGKISCTFNPRILPHLIGLRQKFTKYPLKSAANFSSSYTWRLYELLVSWAVPTSETNNLLAGWIDNQDVIKLRKMLGVPNSYSWAKFNTQILERSVQELLDKRDLVVTIERVKTIRKITHLNIKFIEKTAEDY